MAQCLLAPTPPEIGMAPFRYMDIYKVIQVCVYLYVYIIYIYMYMHMVGSIYCIYMYTYIYICMQVFTHGGYVFVSVYVYIYVPSLADVVGVGNTFIRIPSGYST